MKKQKRLARVNLKAEKERQALVNEIWGDTEPVKLVTIAQRLESPWRERFLSLAERIRSATGKVVVMKKQNEFLITKARNRVNDELKLLLDFARLNRNLYEESGKKSKAANLHKVLDQKV